MVLMSSVSYCVTRASTAITGVVMFKMRQEKRGIKILPSNFLNSHTPSHPLSHPFFLSILNTSP